MQEHYRFAALVHSAQVADVVRAEAERGGMVIKTVVTSLENAENDARSLLDQGYEALLCHGHCRHVIFRKHAKSTLFIERSDIDLLSALLKAREVSTTVMLTAHRDEPRDIALMERLLGMRIHLVAYTNEEDMQLLIREQFARGIRVAVGGGVTSGLMEELGGLNFLDVPQPQNVRDALGRATALVLRNRLESAKLADLKEVLQHIKEGVICVGEGMKFIYSNNRAREFLKTPDERHLSRHFGALYLNRAIEEGVPCVDMIATINGERLLVNTFPVARHSGNAVAVALIHDVESLQKINRKIGDKLYAQGFGVKYTTADIMGNSPVMRTFVSRLRQYAATDATIFIQGETGTGKELAAHAIHSESVRRNRPFVAINCAALSESLLESELFGYEEGAFTGARRGGKPGLFELAHTGTLFLDEIGEISHSVQVCLLRVLEAREVMRVGGGSVTSVDVRVVSASHQPLGKLAREGRFRLDLFYRLVGLYLHMPALRERREDIHLLLDKLLRERGLKKQAISARMRQRLMEQAWPGNVRELTSVVGRYLVLLGQKQADDALFEALLLEQQQFACGAENVKATTAHNSQDSLKERMDRFRAQAVLETLQRHGGDRVLAARELQISVSTLRRSIC